MDRIKKTERVQDWNFAMSTQKDQVVLKLTQTCYKEAVCSWTAEHWQPVGNRGLLMVLQNNICTSLRPHIFYCVVRESATLNNKRVIWTSVLYILTKPSESLKKSTSLFRKIQLIHVFAFKCLQKLNYKSFCT